ncbi:hypothetical protein GCM10023066_56400 [Nocardioides kongjuensis]
MQPLDDGGTDPGEQGGLDAVGRHPAVPGEQPGAECGGAAGEVEEGGDGVEERGSCALAVVGEDGGDLLRGDRTGGSEVVEQVADRRARCGGAKSVPTRAKAGVARSLAVTSTGPVRRGRSATQPPVQRRSASRSGIRPTTRCSVAPWRSPTTRLSTGPTQPVKAAVTSALSVRARSSGRDRVEAEVAEHVGRGAQAVRVRLARSAEHEAAVGDEHLDLVHVVPVLLDQDPHLLDRRATGSQPDLPRAMTASWWRTRSSAYTSSSSATAFVIPHATPPAWPKCWTPGTPTKVRPATSKGSSGSVQTRRTWA